MKKSIIIVLGGILFATLFYNQGLGVNALVYAIALLAALVLLNKKSFYNTTVILSASSMIASALAICWHGSTLSVISYFMSGLLLIGYIASSQASFYISWINGLYNFLFGVFHEVFNEKNHSKQTEKNTSEDLGQIIKITLITAVLIVVFSLLYSSSNPILTQAIESIDLSFIDIFWFFFVAIGALVMANIVQPKALSPITAADLNYSNELAARALDTIQVKSIKNEIQIGSFAIGALNILLLLVLITEVVFLTSLETYPAAAFSTAVHQGIYASIGSILLAMLVITFVFRGDVNFIKTNLVLKRLTFVWISLNALLCLSIFIKNLWYIEGFGLTHKRLGVIIYLVLVLIGLLTTYLKVQHRLNFTYLVRRNMLLAYSVIAIYSVFNWSAIITKHQIKTGSVDHKYLMELLPDNALVLQHQGLDQSAQKFEDKYQIKLEMLAKKELNWQEWTWIHYQLQKERHELAE